MPYCQSTQSGIFYSVLANNAAFLATDTGDTGIKLKSYELDDFIFNLSDTSDFFDKLRNIEDAFCRSQAKQTKMKRDINYNFKAALSELVD